MPRSVRKTKKATKKKAPPEAPHPVIRSTLHLVLAGRKPARHTLRDEKRAAQKLRRALEEE